MPSEKNSKKLMVYINFYEVGGGLQLTGTESIIVHFGSDQQYMVQIDADGLIVGGTKEAFAVVDNSETATQKSDGMDEFVREAISKVDHCAQLKGS